MKTIKEINERIEQLKELEYFARNDIENCEDYTFLDIDIQRNNILQHERQILEWVLSYE